VNIFKISIYSSGRVAEYSLLTLPLDTWVLERHRELGGGGGQNSECSPQSPFKCT